MKKIILNLLAFTFSGAAAYAQSGTVSSKTIEGALMAALHGDATNGPCAGAGSVS